MEKSEIPQWARERAYRIAAEIEFKLRGSRFHSDIDWRVQCAADPIAAALVEAEHQGWAVGRSEMASEVVKKKEEGED